MPAAIQAAYQRIAKSALETPPTTGTRLHRLPHDPYRPHIPHGIEAKSPVRCPLAGRDVDIWRQFCARIIGPAIHPDRSHRHICDTINQPAPMKKSSLLLVDDDRHVLESM